MRVGDHFDSWGGITPSTLVDEYWNGSIPWISSKDVKQPRLSYGEDFITEKALNESRLRLCPTGSVLVVVRGGILAHTLPIAVTEAPVAINQDLKAFFSSNPTLNEWLALALRAYAPEILSSSRKDGTTVHSIRFADLKNWRIPVPPSTEQTRILDRVAELLQQVNAARARLERVPEILKRFRQAVLAAACSGRLTDDWREVQRVSQSSEVTVSSTGTESLPSLPIGWVWRPLKDLGTDGVSPVQTGPFGAQLHRSEFVTEGVPVVAVGNLTGTSFTRSALYYITQTKSEQLRRYNVFAGDVLFARSGATLGKVCVAPSYIRDWRMTGHILRLRIDQRILLSEVAFYALSAAPAVREQVSGNIRGVTRPGFNTSLLESISVPVPPTVEQREIVRRVEALFALADRIERRLAAASERADRLTQAVLSKALRGELVATEAELVPLFRTMSGVG